MSKQEILRKMPAACGLDQLTPFDQSTLAVAISVGSLLSLLIKFYFRPAQRTRRQLLKDGVKQLAGAFFLHCMNAPTSQFLAKAVQIKAEAADINCSWYWVQIMVDTTLGVWVTFIIMDNLMNTFTRLGMNARKYELARSERVGRAHVAPQSDLEAHLVSDRKEPLSISECSVTEAPSLFITFKQIVVWLLVLFVMKMAMVGFLLVFALPLIQFSQHIFMLIPAGAGSQNVVYSGVASIRMWFATVITPFIMNTIQYWMFDNISINIYQSALQEEHLRNAGLNYDHLHGSYRQLQTIIHDLQANKAALGLKIHNLEAEKKTLEQKLNRVELTKDELAAARLTLEKAQSEADDERRALADAKALASRRGMLAGCNQQ